eukprot:jgi/Botrbrau1/1164/Bobra.0162s0052.1
MGRKCMLRVSSPDGSAATCSRTRHAKLGLVVRCRRRFESWAAAMKVDPYRRSTNRECQAPIGHFLELPMASAKHGQLKNLVVDPQQAHARAGHSRPSFTEARHLL